MSDMNNNKKKPSIANSQRWKDLVGRKIIVKNVSTL